MAKSGTPQHILEDAEATFHWYSEHFDDPPEPIDQPKREAASSNPISCILSPPPHVEEITEPIKSTDHEPLIEDMPMLIHDLFIKEKYMDLSNASNMSKEHKCICSRFEAFILDTTSQIEDRGSGIQWQYHTDLP